MNTETDSGALVLDLRLHGICWVVPEGASIDAGKVDLPGGALILGSFSGSIICKEGSLIIARQGQFSGKAKADKVYVEGSILPVLDGSNSILQGRHLVAVSQLAAGSCDLISSAFAIHTTNTTKFSARLTTLPGA